MPQTELVTRAHLQRLLLIGFCASALLLLSALLVALRTVHQIDQNAQLFANRQALAKAAIDDIERQETDLNAQWLELAQENDVVDRDVLLQQIHDARAKMSSALETAYGQAELLRESIYQEGHGLLRWTVWLFAGCVGLSLLCALWAVRASAALFGRLEQQSAELIQMQYQFLETQEETARRFSHELHDELGQTLTAMKANLSAMRGGSQTERLDDCMRLVDQAIHDVREMSQLLRPTILDDFGLDAALRSLTDSFSQRTGIQVKYQSNVDGRRLNDDTETNLFRIAQEALTNVARHSQATLVNVDLEESAGAVTLKISDNGKGFDSGQRNNPGLGLAGMQTRARGCGGTLRIENEPGKGLRVEVSCPSDKV